MYKSSKFINQWFPQKVLIAALLFCISWPVTAYAQNDLPLYCANLTAEDCTILTTARETMAQLDSITADAAVELNVSNIPDVPFDEITIEMEMETAYMFSEEALAVREQLSDAQMISTMMQEDPVEFFELYMGIMDGSNFETNYTISLSDDTMTLLQQAIEEDSGEELPFELPNEFAFSARMLDGTLFANYGELLDPLPGLAIKGEVWFGMEYTPMMEIMFPLMRADGDLDPMNPDEAKMVSQFVAAFAGNSNGPLATTIAGLPFSADVMPSLMLERIDDGSAGTATFRTTIDYASLLGEPAVQEMLAELIRDPDFGDTPMSDEEMTEVMAMVQLMGPTVLDSLGLEVIEEIDPETGLLMRGEFHLNWDVEQLAPLLQMAGGPDITELGEMPVIVLNGTATYANHGEELVIDEPETAIIIAFSEILEIIPEEDLQALMSGPDPDSFGEDFDFNEPAGSITVDQEQIGSAVAAGDSELAASFAADASTAYDEGDYANAIALLNGAIAIEPTNVEYLTARAEINYDLSEYGTALEDYSAALELDTQNADLYVDRALTYYSLGDIQAEIADYAAAIAINPTVAQVYYFRALSYEELGEIELAITDYSKAIELEPDDSYKVWARALLYEQLGKNAEAIADYERYLELEPDAYDREDVEAKIAELQ